MKEDMASSEEKVEKKPVKQGKFKVPDVKSKHFPKYVEQMASCESKVYAITGTTTGTRQRRCSVDLWRRRMPIGVPTSLITYVQEWVFMP